MKQFRTILGFELANYYKNKLFVGITIFLIVAIVAVMFFPRISEAIGSDKPQEKPVMLVYADDNTVLAAMSQQFADRYTLQETDDNAESIRDAVTSGRAECAVVIADDLKTFTYYVNNKPLYNIDEPTVTALLQTLYLNRAMQQSGLTSEQIAEIYEQMSAIDGTTVSYGKDQASNFLYTYVMIFALYMVIILYGQMVATGVATEKGSRTMELLITSVKTTPMMFGKVIAGCIAGFVQLLCVFGTSVLCYNLNKTYWQGNAMISSAFNMPLELVLYMLLFFVLGFFIYAFMYGAVGSTVGKPEDINTAAMPITLIFVAAFMIVVFSVTSGNVDSTLMVVCSFIPFTSPMAMFTRIAMSVVPAWQIGLSVSILAASVAGIGVLSAKIYRVGVLIYGTKPRFSRILRMIATRRDK